MRVRIPPRPLSSAFASSRTFSSKSATLNGIGCVSALPAFADPPALASHTSASSRQLSRPVRCAPIRRVAGLGVRRAGRSKHLGGIAEHVGQPGHRLGLLPREQVAVGVHRQGDRTVSHHGLDGLGVRSRHGRHAPHVCRRAWKSRCSPSWFTATRKSLAARRHKGCAKKEEVRPPVVSGPFPAIPVSPSSPKRPRQRDRASIQRQPAAVAASCSM